MNTTQQTLQKLTNDGYAVRITHFRFPAGIIPKGKQSRRIAVSELITNVVPRTEFEKGNSKESIAIDSMGGKTEVEITKPDGSTILAESICSPRDHFNRRLGVSIALGRAMTKLI